MKLLPVAPLLLLLTVLEARPKPAGEPWPVGVAWRREKQVCEGREALGGQLAARGEGTWCLFSGGIPRRMEDPPQHGT